MYLHVGSIGDILLLLRLGLLTLVDNPPPLKTIAIWCKQGWQDKYMQAELKDRVIPQ